MKKTVKKIFLPAILFAALTAISSCGIKRPPLPPEKLFPLAVKDPRVTVRDGCADLSWKYPGLTPPEKYRVLRTEQSGSGPAPNSAEQTFEVPGTESLFHDCSLKAGFLYGFQVTGVSKARLEGEPSKTVWAHISQLPPAPENLRAAAGDRFVDLAWTAAAGMAYNLYRSKDSGKFSSHPLNLGPMVESKYSDGNLENGKEYFYCLRATVVEKDYPPLESGCALAAATPIDLIAPAAPRGLAAALADKAVQLKWFKSPEPDLLGYLVYRRRPGAQSWKKITAEPMVETEYVDKQAFKLKGRFEYAVSAVDNAPSKNQGRRSQVELVSVP
jgi:hypothetical protein